MILRYIDLVCVSEPRFYYIFIFVCFLSFLFIFPLLLVLVIANIFVELCMIQCGLSPHLLRSSSASIVEGVTIWLPIVVI